MTQVTGHLQFNAQQQSGAPDDGQAQPQTLGPVTRRISNLVELFEDTDRTLRLANLVLYQLAWQLVNARLRLMPSPAGLEGASFVAMACIMDALVSAQSGLCHSARETPGRKCTALLFKTPNVPVQLLEYSLGRSMNKSLLVVCFTGAIGVAGAAHAQIVLNGGIERPDTVGAVFVNIYPTNYIPNWSVHGATGSPVPLRSRCAKPAAGRSRQPEPLSVGHRANIRRRFFPHSGQQ